MSGLCYFGSYVTDTTVRFYFCLAISCCTAFSAKYIVVHLVSSLSAKYIVDPLVETTHRN